MSITIDGVNNLVKDTNGNEAVRLPSAASAVNDVTIANAATGGSPTISATGDDTNIHLTLAGKGTGTVISQANVADANVIGGLPVIHRIDVAAGTTGNVDVVLTHKSRVINVWLVKKSAAGGGGGTIQVKNGSTAITDAMSIDVADQTVVRCATIDDAAWEIAAAGTLRITRTRTASTDETCTVYVECVRVA